LWVPVKEICMMLGYFKVMRKLTPTILKKENRNAWGGGEINFLLWATIIMFPCLKGIVAVNFAYLLIYF